LFFSERYIVGKRGALSVARHEQSKLGSVSHLALTAALGLAALPAFSTVSWAACDPVGGNQYVCSGTNTTRQTINSPVGTLVTTVPGFIVDTTGSNDGNALEILGGGPKGYTDLNGSVLNGSMLSSGLVVDSTDPDAGQVVILTNGTISGAGGISAGTSGAGASLSVTASGAVTGRERSAISVRNGVGSGDISVVTAGPVSGNTLGIEVVNSGIGETRVVTTGTVQGTLGYGISIDNSATATNVSVEAASVIGGTIGILAYNFGTGATSITATEAVTGTSDFGVWAYNTATATNMSVEAASVIGGRTGILTYNYGTGATSITATEAVTGTREYGVWAYNGATTLGGLSIRVGDVTGGLAGIAAANNGAGTTMITAGNVSGGYGIVATNAVVDPAAFQADAADAALNGGLNAAATDLTVQAASINATQTGILAVNNGSGQSAITATGLVEGTGGYGIFATNGAAATNITVEAADVRGGISGIRVSNTGTGAARVAATGLVEGTTTTGIHAYNSGSASDLTIEAVGVTGGLYGIDASNYGTGATWITALGAVEGTSDAGIYAYNGVGASHMTIEAAGLRGGRDGIVAWNDGRGITSIMASGAVTGTARYGAIAYSGPATLGGLSVYMADVTGAVTGIAAANSGAGATVVMANHVSSGGYGIVATNGTVDPVYFIAGAANAALNGGSNAAATDLTVQVASVSSVRSGIFAMNNGTGANAVTATGAVASAVGNGIYARNGSTATNLTIDAAGVRGGYFGIAAENEGTGATSISTSGLVEGGMAAILASSAGQPITIDSHGLLRNLSQLSTSVAVQGGGGPIALTSNGNMVGTVQFGTGAHTMMNNSRWNTSGGMNEFGGGTLTNTAGNIIFGAANGGAAETTAFGGLSSFTNHGIMSMADGGAGDIVRQAGGNARFETGSMLAIDIDGAGHSDRFITTGTATLTGTTLAVFPAGIMPASGTRYTVLTADGGLTGQFASLSGLPANTAFLTIEDTYDANNAYLDVIKYRTFASAGLSPNQIVTAGGLDSMLPGPVVNAVAALTTDARAQHAFDQLSGEVHASARTVTIEDTRFLRNAVNDRLRAAFGGVGASAMPVMAYADGGPQYVPATTDRFAVWGQAFGSWGHWNSDGNAARLNRSTGGFFVGADAPLFDTWRFGAVAGYSRTNFNVRDRASSGSSDNYHLGVYGGTSWGDLAFRTGAAYTWYDITTSRSVVFPGFGDNLKGKYDAGATQVFGELAYDMNMGSARFEPFANLAYVNLHTDGFRETGGAAALTSPSANIDAAFTTLGLRTSTSFTLGEAAVTAKGTLGWRHAFGDVTPNTAMRFASGGDAFSIGGVPIARNAAVIEAGLDFNLSPSAVLGVSYGGQFGSGVTDQTFRANFNMKF
jgi:outer membrane autotransporter protein